MSHFALGEVAVYWRPECVYHRAEVTITSALRHAVYWENGKQCEGWVYDIDAPDIGLDPVSRALLRDHLVCPPQYLRKKRPPPDWAKLCELDQVPSRRKAEEVA